MKGSTPGLSELSQGERSLKNGGKPKKFSDISIENSASVWIFGSLLSNSQSRLRSDGKRNFSHGGK